MAAICPNCAKQLPGDFPYCPFCAAPIRETASAPVREERKVVSVLFCDLVGFTAASEHADPEDVRARLRPYHAQLQQVIEGHGGTVEKFVGDAVMAVFGAPVAHEDDAERAVRTGLRILEAIEELNRRDEKLQLQVRVGINTGEAVVALGAHPERGEGFVTGDVVNTASRLQGIAPINGVAVSEPTYRQTERVFIFDRLEPVQVKGKADPLAVWQPLAARARFGADVIRTSSTPLVGREFERRQPPNDKFWFDGRPVRELLRTGAASRGLLDGSDRRARLRVTESSAKGQQQFVGDARTLEQRCLEIPDCQRQGTDGCFRRHRR